MTSNVSPDFSFHVPNYFIQSYSCYSSSISMVKPTPPLFLWLLFCSKFCCCFMFCLCCCFCRSMMLFSLSCNGAVFSLSWAIVFSIDSFCYLYNSISSGSWVCFFPANCTSFQIYCFSPSIAFLIAKRMVFDLWYISVSSLLITISSRSFLIF